MISKILCITIALMALNSVTQKTDPEPEYVPEPRRAIVEAPPSSDSVETDMVPEPRHFWQQYDITSPFEQVLLTSTNYPNYPYGVNEIFNIVFTSPVGSLINFSCDNIFIEQITSNSCSKDYMAISPSGSTDFFDGVKVCGQESNFRRVSTTNRLAFSFVSGQRWWNYYNYGFRCVVSMASTPTSTTAKPVTTTTITTTTTKPTTTTAASVAPAATTAASVAPAATTAASVAPAATTAASVAPAATTAASVAPATTATTTNAPSTCSCGVKNEGARIVNGVNTAKNEIPWRCYMAGKSTYGYCGCTIIDNSWCMTAAHCTVDANMNDVYVVCGDYDQSTQKETTEVKIKVDKITQHTGYNNKTQDNDISLLHLSTPLTYSKTISPACLPWNGEGNNCETPINVMASGWGVTSSGGKISAVMKKVTLPCMSSTECGKYYKNMITNNMICTYTPGKDACQGDSGGSIDYMDEKTGRYNAIGVVSWGVGCASTNKPGVFTKVTNYLQWIKDNAKGAQFCNA